MGKLIVPADVKGRLLDCQEGISFWGGIDPATGQIIDAHHPRCGDTIAGRVLAMPTSRGSCSGSGVLLELALNDHAPAALIFREPEGILTLGAVISTHMFDRPVAAVHLSPSDYSRVIKASEVSIQDRNLTFDGERLELSLVADKLELTDPDEEMRAGKHGPALKLAMETLCTMAAAEGATRLVDVSSGHIDGCIYAAPAYLTFAETMRDMGARVRIPTTMNALSVDRDNWREQGVAADFGEGAELLAEAYVQMGAGPSYTCAPYQEASIPAQGDYVGWSESNAVIFANSVLGARSAKHPDFLDLFIAMTGRAPLSGVYLDDSRRPAVVIDVDLPRGAEDAVWPLLGWLAGKAAPDRIPLLKGLKDASPNHDDLRAMCAAFGTTSAAPMLHVEGVTPEAELDPPDGAARVRLGREDLVMAWKELNGGPEAVDLVALGSPHMSLQEIRRFEALMKDRHAHADTSLILTLGRGVRALAAQEGLVSALEECGATLVCDICWCSITEPVFPISAKTLMTNSGKYAHYAPGLCGRNVRFGSLADCADAATSGIAPKSIPAWLA